MVRRLQPKLLTVIAIFSLVLAFVPAAAARGSSPLFSGFSNNPLGVDTSSGSGTTGNSSSTNTYVVYGDALASGWHDQSWDANVNYAYPRGAYSGRDSISYRATAAWAGLDIRSDSGVNGASYGQLTFALKATKNNQQYAVYLRGIDGQNLTEPVSLADLGGQPLANRWKTYSIPLASLGAADAMIGHIVIHEWTGAAQPIVYVDQIQFSGTGQGVTKSPNSAPVTTPAPTPSPTPSPSPTPVTSPVSSADVIWSADTETGNLDQWTQGQYGEAVFNSGTGDVTVSQDVAHSGSSALKMTITDANGTTQAARIFRWNDPDGNALPASAYYSVWYYFPQTYTPDQWWDVMQFKSKSSSGQTDPMWVLNVGNRSNGNMYFYLWDAMHSKSYDAAPQVDVPVGRWVHIETYFQRSTGNSGQITIWQDGVKLFDLSGIQTTTSDNQQWALSNYTDNINPVQPRDLRGRRGHQQELGAVGRIQGDTCARSRHASCIGFITTHQRPSGSSPDGRLTLIWTRLDPPLQNHRQFECSEGVNFPLLRSCNAPSLIRGAYVTHLGAESPP